MTEYYGEYITTARGFIIHAESDKEAMERAQKMAGTNLLMLYRYKNLDAKLGDVDYHDFEYIYNLVHDGPFN